MGQKLKSKGCLLVSLVLFLSVADAGEATKIVANGLRQRRLSRAEQKWLSADWKPFLPYTRIVAIKNSRHVDVVLLISVQAASYYRAQPGSTTALIELPHALLFSPSGADLGSLPHTFPDDPPIELRVTFTDWRHDFPRRIDLFVIDPRASGDHSLPPLVWSEEKKKFLRSEEKRRD